MISPGKGDNRENAGGLGRLADRSLPNSEKDKGTKDKPKDK
jgi:hypothetical protein